MNIYGAMPTYLFPLVVLAQRYNLGLRISAVLHRYHLLTLLGGIGCFLRGILEGERGASRCIDYLHQKLEV